MVFCIDVRSEPFRRSIEKLGHYESFGFAGFFGIAVSIKEYESPKIKNYCPVLLKPRFKIAEKLHPENKHDIKRYRQLKQIKTMTSQVYQQLKCNFSTPFTLVEAMGLWCGIGLVFKSLAPRFYSRMRFQWNHILGAAPQTEPNIEVDIANETTGIPLEDQISHAEMALRLMSLTENFAKIVIFCGHGSSTENNPYASALDCGACGGNQGGKSAQLLAFILNKEKVRLALAKKAIHIPPDTIFYAGQHDTTTDDVTIYPSNNSANPHQEILEKLQSDLKLAKINNNHQRNPKLVGLGNSNNSIERRSVDWSETRPEWGLARNAAFIVGPRHFTQGINLEGRCFLQSYDWRKDTEGELLQTILTAPMVVAQWINTQYLFSTIDNVNYGSGSKITHNVTGKIGVMQGSGSDLMHGLPLQSVMSSDENLYHSPQRLLTVVYAPREIVSTIIQRHEVLKSLFLNQWVHLLIIEPNSHQFYELEKDNRWKLLQ